MAQVAVTSNDSWNVTKSAGADWLTLNKTTGTGNDTLTVTASANPDVAGRNATITLKTAGNATATITVSQAAAGSSISVLPTTIAFKADGTDA